MLRGEGLFLVKGWCVVRATSLLVKKGLGAVLWMGISVVGKNSIHDGNWHHLAAVRDGNSGHTLLYVDGELQADSARTYMNNFVADVNIQVANLYIDYTNKYFYEGKLDEIAIYNRALTADEIRAHYRHGLSGADYCDAARLGPFIILEPFH